MSFMQPEILHDLWAVIEGAGYTEVFPADLIGFSSPAEYDFTALDEGEEMPDWAYAALDYLQHVKPNNMTTVSIRYAYGARFSAPGYMDCTDWTLFDTREEAEDFLREELLD